MVTLSTPLDSKDPLLFPGEELFRNALRKGCPISAGVLGRK